MHPCEYILSVFANQMPSVSFLEGIDGAKKRYDQKQIILFTHYGIDGKKYVIKYYSLEHLDGEQKQKEKKSVFDEFLLAKAFERHQGVINVYDHNVLMVNGRELGAYYTMDHFEMTLNTLFSHKIRFSDEDVLAFLWQMNDILSHAHFQEGMVHSDIKPANIGIVKDRGRYLYKLMDFDVSVRIEKKSNGGQSPNFSISDRISIRGMTPAYAAPEQIIAQINSDTTITGKVDIYAVGVIAVQMLTGKPPKQQKDSLLYHVPLRALPRQWYQILGSICHPEIKHRPKRIAGVLPRKTKEPLSLDKIRAIAITTLTLIAIVFVLFLNQLGNDSSTAEAPPQEENELQAPWPPDPPKAPPEESEPEKKEDDLPSLIMPKLNGRTFSDAKNHLKRMGISVELIYEYAAPANQNKVINTIPNPGDKMNDEKASVTLIVGKTP